MTAHSILNRWVLIAEWECPSTYYLRVSVLPGYCSPKSVKIGTRSMLKYLTINYVQEEASLSELSLESSKQAAYKEEEEASQMEDHVTPAKLDGKA